MTATAVVVLVTASGALAALTDPARPTRPWVEAVVTLAVTVAAVLAGAGPVVRPSAWPGARRRRGSATPDPRLTGSPTASSGTMPPAKNVAPVTA